MPESPGEVELLLRVQSEDARARVARRAFERWVTAARLRAAIQRRGLSGVEAATYVCDALWPGMPAAHRDAVLRAVAAGGFELVLPGRVEDCVDPRELALLVEAGFI